MSINTTQGLFESFNDLEMGTMIQRCGTMLLGMHIVQGNFIMDCKDRKNPPGAPCKENSVYKAVQKKKVIKAETY